VTNYVLRLDRHSVRVAMAEGRDHGVRGSLLGARGGADVIAPALKLSVYFGESLAAGPDLACDALIGSLARHDLACSVLLRGAEGYGINRRIHAERSPTCRPTCRCSAGPSGPATPCSRRSPTSTPPSRAAS
jgi:uncharacterized protein DUF190